MLAQHFRHYCILSILLLALLATSSCQRAEFHGNDFKMVRCGKILAKAIDAYFTEEGEYPQKLRDAQRYLDPGATWPNNPYNNKPVEDTGSPDFDPATSVGMVCYERVMREEQQVTYQLHIFGDKGKLYTIGNTAVRMKDDDSKGDPG